MHTFKIQILSISEEENDNKELKKSIKETVFYFLFIGFESFA